MKRGIQISIPQPCHEGWQNMQPVERGRFCQACQKCVVDFTNYTDAEILKYFSQNKENTCGRFKAGQLNRALEIEKTYPAQRHYKFFAGMALFLGFTHFAASQTIAPPPIVITEGSTADSTINNPEKISPKLPADSLVTISGIVLDSVTNEPIYAAPVIIKGTTYGAATDFDGRFKFSVPENKIKNGVVLNVSYIGYYTYSLSVLPGKTENNVIRLSENTELQGEIIVVAGKTNFQNGSPASEKPSFFQRVKHFFRRIF